LQGKKNIVRNSSEGKEFIEEKTRFVLQRKRPEL
jgi:hypothetical protein